ncbi:MAG: caspase family protein [Solirubrobacterales bacterium]|nr:caspase family protein [Solirubrobacterales bacterium]
MAEHQWALLVGATTYEFFNQLKYSAADAEDFAGALERRLNFARERILLLGDVNRGADFPPVRSKVFHALGCLSNRESDYYANKGIEPIGEDDVFVFYFSGHGLRTRDGDQYLLPIDASDQTPWDTAVDLAVLTKQISNLPCRHKVLFIDACRSEFDEGAKAPQTMAGVGFDENLSREGIATFFSCDPLTRSYEIGGDISHGSFTYCLLEAIRNPQVNTLSELHEYLKTRVPKLNVDHKKAPQAPFFVPNPADMGKLRLLATRQKVDISVVDRLMEKANDWLSEEKIDYVIWDTITAFLDEVQNGGGSNVSIKLSILNYFFDGEIRPEGFLKRWQRIERTTKSVGDSGPKVDLSPA